MMGSLSIWHWLILAVVVAVLFGGRGKLSSVMGDAAKGIKAFRDGLKEGDHPRRAGGHHGHPGPARPDRTRIDAGPAGVGRPAPPLSPFLATA